MPEGNGFMRFIETETVTPPVIADITIEYDTTKIRFFVRSMSLAENDPKNLVDGYPIVINHVPHALTLTKIKQSQSAGPYGTTVNNCHITIYDQYGNSGKFTAFRNPARQRWEYRKRQGRHCEAEFEDAAYWEHRTAILILRKNLRTEQVSTRS